MPEIRMIVWAKPGIFLSWVQYHMDTVSKCPWASNGEDLFYWHTWFDAGAKGPSEPERFIINLGKRLNIEDGSPLPIFYDCPEPRHYPEDGQYPELGGEQVIVELFSLGEKQIEVNLVADPLEWAGCLLIQELYREIDARFHIVHVTISPSLADKAGRQKGPEEPDDVVEREESVPAGKPARKRRRPEKIRKRQELVKLYYLRGDTEAQILQALGKWSIRTIKRDKKALRKRGEID